MIEALFSLLLAWLLVWLLVPLIRGLGIRFGIVDYPNHRKIHQEPTPCSGGVALYLAFFGSLFLILLIFPHLCPEIGTEVIKLSLVGAFLLLLGIYDDKKDMTAHWKLLSQIIIILMAIGLGFRIDTLANPFGGVFYLGWISIPITLFWFLGFINAMNLIDGLDGLASGIAAITSLILLLSTFVSGDKTFSILAATLTGATLSFLRFNFSHKRKVFLGDNGSMLLGLLLGGISIIGSHKGATFGLLLITTLCLGVPIYDTTLAIIRRLKREIHIFSPDKEHIHHRFLKSGMSQKGTILTIYGITFILGLIGLLSLHNIGLAATIIISGSVVLLIKWGFGRLRKFQEGAE